MPPATKRPARKRAATPIDAQSKDVTRASDPENNPEPEEADHADLLPVIHRAEVVPIAEGGLELPVIDTARLIELNKAYVALCEGILNDSDYQSIGNRAFKKKSAWRKLATAFGVSVELIDEDITYDSSTNRIVRAHMRVRATAPNGRFMEGIGICDVFERCCLQGCGTRHTHCDAACDGARHFSHAEHDIPATAMTRATNRACADLFGMGEVSAEEMEGDGERSRSAPSSSTGRKVPSVNELRADIARRIAQWPEGSDARKRLAADWKHHRLPKGSVLTAAQCRFAGDLLSNVEAEYPSAPASEGQESPPDASESPATSGGNTDDPVTIPADTPDDLVEATITEAQERSLAEVVEWLAARHVAVVGDDETKIRRAYCARRILEQRDAGNGETNKEQG